MEEKEILLQILGELRALREILSQPVPSERKFITLQEASAISGLSVRQLREYIRQGVLTRYGSRRKTLIFSGELLEAMRAGFKKPEYPTPSGRTKKLRIVKVQKPPS